MSNKAAKKKQYILDTARKVFAKKGFTEVTMKDIVEACEISRGGLYIYFQSTEEILDALLKLESEETDDAFGSKVRSNCTAGEFMALFLKEQKKELLSEEDNLCVAVYEYLFMKSRANGADLSGKSKFNKLVVVLSRIISEGVDNGEFYCEDPEGAAHNMLYVIEGLKIIRNTYGITEEEVDGELLYILSGLIADE